MNQFGSHTYLAGVASHLAHVFLDHAQLNVVVTCLQQHA